MKRTKSLITSLILVLIFAFGGCINEKQNLDKGNGVNLERKGEVVTVYPKEELLGIKVYVDKKILSKNIEVGSDDIKIVKYNEKGTEISIASKNGKLTKEDLKIKSNEKIEVDILSKVTPESINNYNIKRVNTGNELLGDFDNSGKVDLLDFGKFLENYDTTNTNYDIAPASKGSGDWADIFCTATKDGNVNLLDLVVFGNNYDKTKPIPIKEVSGVTITGLSELNKGESTTLTSEVSYTDGTKDNTGVMWSSSDETVATVLAGVVTGEKAGTAVITASKDGKASTKEITVKEINNGITIYLEKPSTWTPYIWYDSDLTTAAWDTAALKDSNTVMTEYRTGWYKKDIGISSGVEFLFNDGSWANKFDTTGITTASQTQNFKITSTVWITKDGVVHNTDPYEPTKPVITVSDSGTYSGDYEINISIASDIDITSKTCKFGDTDITLDSNNKIIKLSDYLLDKGTKALTITATNSKGTTTVTKEFTRDDNNVNSKLKIHFRKPLDWGEAYIHYWGTVVNVPTVWTNGIKLNDEGNGWFGIVLVGDSSAQILFKDKAGEPTKRVGNFEITKESWIDGNKIYYRNPDWAQPAVLYTNPDGGYFQTTIDVMLNISLDNRTTILDKKYTLDGTDPKVNGINFENGTHVIIGSAMNDEDKKTIKIWSEVKVNDTGELLESTYESTFIKGAPEQPNKLGAVYSPEKTVFSIWSPDTSNVKVKVDGVEYSCIKVNDFDGYTNIYSATVTGDLNLKEYQFIINGTVVRDPYGNMVKPGKDINIVVDMDGIKPDGGSWAVRPKLVEREDSVIYEMHVRDFTIDSTSGVDDDKKGKFLGMVQSGTTYEGIPTGIDHLKELGITHIQIMPIYDFATGMYNWGYDPVNYNVPEEQYSMTPNDYANRVKELKTMVNEFHKAGIRVIMDVVYNHTFTNDIFENITPKYFDGLNLSGCGNSVDTGNPMVSRFIRDSLEHWIRDYNIDGFRFDLAGIFYIDAVKNWGEYLNNKYPDRNILMYGEPWNGYATDPNEGQKVRMGKAPLLADAHFGMFNGKMRDAIRGNGDKVGPTERGYMFNYLEGDHNANAIKMGSRGGIEYLKSKTALSNDWDPMFAYDPEQSINYISAHDNLCLWDKIKFEGITGDYAKRIDKFGMGIVLTSQGIPFIHGGDEMLRTKGNDMEAAKNSYNQPDSVNSIKWNWEIDNSGVYNYYKSLIKLRKEHPGFRLNTWDEINDWMTTYIPSDRQDVVVSEIDADKNGDSYDEIVVVYNPGSNYTVSLPGTGWSKIFDVNGLNPADQSDIVEGTSIAIFAK